MTGSQIAVLAAAAVLCVPACGQIVAPRVNQVGSYGPWLADEVLGEGPGRLSFRNGKWKSVEQWQQAARKRVLECIAPVQLGATPVVTVTGRTTYDGLDIEVLSWQLPMGPRTEAVLLKPAGARGPLPGILGLHDHGGNKFLGWRKIARTDATPWTVQEQHQAEYYGRMAWANGARRGRYAGLGMCLADHRAPGEQKLIT